MVNSHRRFRHGVLIDGPMSAAAFGGNRRRRADSDRRGLRPSPPLPRRALGLGPECERLCAAAPCTAGLGRQPPPEDDHAVLRPGARAGLGLAQAAVIGATSSAARLSSASETSGEGHRSGSIRGHSPPVESAVRPGVSEQEHCVTQARRLSCCPKGNAILDMTRVLRELPLTYPVPSERSWGCSASAVHERRPAEAPYRASSLAPTRPSARAIPSPRSPDSSTPRVRLHLKPGQKGTKQLLAQDGDRLICLRYRYDAPAPSTAAVRPGPDRRRTRRLCRRRRPLPGEAGRRHVEPGAKGLAATLRSRGRARPARPHRRRPRIQYQMPNAKQGASPSRCPAAI